jgi:hypothetical protein
MTNSVLPWLTGAAGTVLGAVFKSLWDKYFGWQSAIPIETWKIRTSQLGRLLSEFYWPLYVRLMRDDVVWEKVFYDLRRGNDRSSGWARDISADDKNKLSREIEAKVLLPNHLEAIGIIRSSIHLAECDGEFLYLKNTYAMSTPTVLFDQPAF